MLICDLCRKRVQAYDSIVLYSKRIDYCKACKPKVVKLVKRIKKKKREIEERNKDNFDKEIRSIELILIEKMKGM